ncbi:MAG: HD-GYP domain-containing protein [Spongiibacteraceae bacterium]|nr:HD-GYP domain-containing protein [Spongiibacteraceae bacterium]
MAKEKKVKLSVNKLKPGLYIDLGLSWSQHPFLFRQFTIKSSSEIKIIQDLGLMEVTVYPERCKIDIPKEQVEQSLAVVDKDQMWEEKKQRIDEAAKYRHTRNKKSKEYRERVKQIQNLTKNLKTAPANAIRSAREVADIMSAAFGKESEVLINLVNFTDDCFTMHHHSLNVTVLTLSIAKELGITDIELRRLCMGAILHDIGKASVPAKVLMKKSALTISEKKLLNTHPLFGGKLARKIEGASDEVAQIIEQHHEYIDGTGYPKKLKGDEIGQLARIVAITNCYDNLCNPANTKNALTPKAAMAILYAKYKDKLDTKIVQHFIKTMGVYPPGTVVSLSDGSIGLVTAVNSSSLLQPHILLYHDDVPRSEALHINLSLHPNLSIKDALISGECPKRIYDYLGIRERTGYYYDQLQ